MPFISLFFLISTNLKAFMPFISLLHLLSANSEAFMPFISFFFLISANSEAFMPFILLIPLISPGSPHLPETTKKPQLRLPDRACILINKCILDPPGSDEIGNPDSTGTSHSEYIAH